ncbi:MULTISPECIES: hypothetical protein [unclassified Carboxylicivirga]|uniref:hypothetical protein n=1 Tax=Carboxylicivirga TaxID=1628153 RepID=UPI003D35762D
MQLLEHKQHPEQAYRSCMGVLSMAKKVGNQRLSNACKRALEHHVFNYKIVHNILKRGLDKIDEESDDQQSIPFHNNIRGDKYYE